MEFTRTESQYPRTFKPLSILLSAPHDHYDIYRGTEMIGSKLSITRVLGVSGICGSLFFFWPSILHAMDGSRRRVMLLEGHSSTFDFSEVEEKHALWVFVRRFKLPVFFFFTVLTYWDHPALLAIKIILFLLTTKPSPFSVYVLVEQSLYANKVEVQDYKLICLARVEIRGQKFRFVGMLGGWWILPLSSEHVALTSAKT
ncbi:hypothetical protein ACFE04_009679 [Oxalis oulophora]